MDMELLENDEYTWTTAPLSKDVKLHASLKDFESSLRCPICAQLFSNPVILTSTNSKGQCEHTFCSECIRSYFAKTRRTSAKGSGSLHCPVCRNATDERKLIPNRLVGECTLSWKAMRGSLLKVVRDNAKNHLSKDDGKSSKSKSGNKRHATSKITRTSKRPRRSNRIKNIHDSDVSNDENDDDDTETDNSDEDEYNPNISILTNSDEENGVKTMARAVNSNGIKVIKMKSSYHYHGMKRKQLQKLCASEKLPTHGTDKELKDRHMKFITLYNAECDSNNPRSQLDLVKVLMAREKHEKEEKMLALQSGATAHSSLVNKLVQSYRQVQTNHETSSSIKVCSNDEGLKCNQQNLNPEKNIISSGNTNFDKEVQSNYRLMIDRLNQQKGGKTRQASHKVVGHDSKPNGIVTSSSPCSTQPHENVEKHVSQTQPQHPSPIHQQLPTSTQKQQQQQQQQPTQSIKKSNNPIPSVVGPWVCPKCTFRNTTRTWSNAKCEICLGKRPSPTGLSSPNVHPFSRGNFKSDTNNGNDNENGSSKGNGIVTIDV